MGFDSPFVSKVIQAKHPRNMIDFVQQVGRAGRKGRKSYSVVYHNANDIAKTWEVQQMTLGITAQQKGA